MGRMCYRKATPSSGLYLEAGVGGDYCGDKSIRQLTENIPNWAYYLQLEISNLQLRIISQIWDWGFLSQVKQSRGLTEENTQLGIVSPIGYFKFPIGDILPN